MQDIMAWVKENPAFVFIVAIVFIVCIAYFVGGMGSNDPAPAGPQMASEPSHSIEGVPILCNHLATALERNVHAFSGKQYQGIVIETLQFTRQGKEISPEKIKPEYSTSTVAFTLPEDVESLSFTLAQPVISGDITKYAYAANIRILADQEEIKTVHISKDSLLTSDIPLTFTKARQVVIEITTDGKYVQAENEKKEELRDQYGPWLPIAVCDIEVKKKVGENP